MTLKLFDDPPKPRRKRRVLMHVFDAACDAPDEVTDYVRMRCARCDKETDWMLVRRAVAKRGAPCPNCNPKEASE